MYVLDFLFPHFLQQTGTLWFYSFYLMPFVRKVIFTLRSYFWQKVVIVPCSRALFDVVKSSELR